MIDQNTNLTVAAEISYQDRVGLYQDKSKIHQTPLKNRISAVKERYSKTDGGFVIRAITN